MSFWVMSVFNVRIFSAELYSSPLRVGYKSSLREILSKEDCLLAMFDKTFDIIRNLFGAFRLGA